MLRTDSFQEFDRLTQRVFGPFARPASMPMDAYRVSDRFVVEFDLPGAAADSIEVTVEGKTLTVRATRGRQRDENVELLAGERAHGEFARHLLLADTLDAGRLEASYRDGVLRLEIPVAEVAKPRRIEVQTSHPTVADEAERVLAHQ